MLPTGQERKRYALAPRSRWSSVTGAATSSAATTPLVRKRSHALFRSSRLSRRQELLAGCVADPTLVLGGGPVTQDRELDPGVGVVERPDDVGGAGDAEPAPQRARAEALDDRALVGVVLGLDPLPEAGDFRLERGGVADDLEQARRALLEPPRVAGVESQRSLVVRLLEHLPEPPLLRDWRLVALAAKRAVPDRAEHASLRLEAEVDRPRRHPRLLGDRGHRRPRVAVALEQALGGGEDRD